MNKLFTWGACLCAIAALTGCQTMKGAQTAMPGEVFPGPGEGIVTNQAILLVDASGSMYPADKFALAHELAHGFWSAAPSGSYDAGTMSYGSTYTHAWVKYPSEPFNRTELQGAVAMMGYIGGSTPLALALKSTGGEIADSVGRTAVVVFSDGKTEPTEVLDTIARIKEVHQGPLCVYTVQFGDDEAGGKLLLDMVEVAGCGSTRHASAISDPAGMEAFIREIFFGPGGGAGVMTPAGWQGTVQFDADKSFIKPEFIPVVDEAAAMLKADPSLRMRIEGHTDSTSGETHNDRLAQRRADAVANALMQRGISADRISTVSKGEGSPAVSNETPANRALNRRAILISVK